MKSKKETFASLMQTFEYRYELRAVFEDFLTMTMCAVTVDPMKKQSHYEDLYIETIAKYKNDPLRHHFPKLFAALVIEMEAMKDGSGGNDILGNFYEFHFCRKGSGQFFTPWPICEFMATSIIGDSERDTEEQPLRILDPCCGSGRMLLCGAKHNGKHHHYFGIDIDPTCVKMTALNLFFNGIFHAEVMCADALSPDDFRISYQLSLLPLGIFRITDKQRSPLWHSHLQAFQKKEAIEKKGIVLPSEQTDNGLDPNASQLSLF